MSWSELADGVPQILLALLLPLMVALSSDYGVTWDELPSQAYGEKVWRFYEGREQQERFRTDPAGSHLYGGLFDVAAVALQRRLPLNRWVVRHALNAMFKWSDMVACYVLVSRLAGPRAGLLAIVLLAVSARYWADSMNNPKDLPFAACATAPWRRWQGSRHATPSSRSNACWRQERLTLTADGQVAVDLVAACQLDRPRSQGL